jgi:hypothetical protein
MRAGWPRQSAATTAAVTGFLRLSDESGGDFTAEDEDRIRELAAFTGATLDALRAARRPG